MTGWKLDFPLSGFVIAFFIGALIGIEREKKQESHDNAGGIGGLRTFILIAETGAVAAWLSLHFGSPWVLLCTGFMVTALVAVGYYLHAHAHPLPSSVGMTTEVAALLTFLLGALTLLEQKELAVALAIVTSAVLAYKQPLHGLVEKIGQDDLAAGLKLLFATFIVLPVLPNRTVDPWDAINPYKMWLLVIFIASVSLVGYVASRWLGTRRGVTVTGLVGGLVSSTAVTLAFARRSRDEKGTEGGSDALAAGLLLSWAIMFIRILVVATIIYRPLLSPLLTPIGGMAVLMAVLAAFHYRRGTKASVPVHAVPLRNPFSLTFACEFGLLFALVTLMVKLAQQYRLEQGMITVAAIAGLTDVDPITLSMAALAREGGIPALAVSAIVMAAASNTLVKCGFVLALGDPGLKRRISLATLLVLVGTVAFFLA